MKREAQKTKPEIFQTCFGQISKSAQQTFWLFFVCAVLSGSFTGSWGFINSSSFTGVGGGAVLKRMHQDLTGYPVCGHVGI